MGCCNLSMENLSGSGVLGEEWIYYIGPKTHLLILVPNLA